MGRGRALCSVSVLSCAWGLGLLEAPPRLSLLGPADSGPCGPATWHRPCLRLLMPGGPAAAPPSLSWVTAPFPHGCVLWGLCSPNLNLAALHLLEVPQHSGYSYTVCLCTLVCFFVFWTNMFSSVLVGEWVLAELFPRAALLRCHCAENRPTLYSPLLPLTPVWRNPFFLDNCNARGD